jgi:hypothetical protein
MTLPHAFLDVLNKEEPYLATNRRSPKEQADLLQQRENMKGKYLGACFDSSRWGGETTVLYEMNIQQMLGFIQNWMRQNEANFQDLWLKKDDIENLYKTSELPYIHLDSCPRDKSHSGTFTDLAGRIRCSHRTERELEAFESQEPEILVDVCYSILSDKATVLSLETIIRRLNLAPDYELVHCKCSPGRYWRCDRANELDKYDKENYESTGLCPGHKDKVNQIAFPFDGWKLAFYTQRWYEQLPDGKAPLFEKNKDKQQN